MRGVEATELETVCVAAYPRELEATDREHLLAWHARAVAAAAPLTAELTAIELPELREFVLATRAASHPWYEFLRSWADRDVFASFLVEEARMPAFLPLLSGVASALTTEPGRAALAKNISDEQLPAPHAALFQRALEAVRHGARISAGFDRLLADTNLTYYYGFYLDPAFAIGALYATELMVPHRAERMHDGLLRLGLTAEQAEFMRIHAVCDPEHAEDWLKRVIGPELEADPALRISVLEGVAVRLLTSQLYLDSRHAKVARP